MNEISFRGDIDVPSPFLPTTGGTLHSLNLIDCNKITDAGVDLIAAGCSSLQSLHLSGCYQTTSGRVQAIRDSKGFKRIY